LAPGGGVLDIIASSKKRPLNLARLIEWFPNIGLSPMLFLEDGHGIKILFNLRSASNTRLCLLEDLSLLLDASFFIHVGAG
jgi:hypothetical protein